MLIWAFVVHIGQKQFFSWQGFFICTILIHAKRTKSPGLSLHYFPRPVSPNIYDCNDNNKIHVLKMSHVMRKPAFAICEQQSCRFHCVDHLRSLNSVFVVRFLDTSTCYSWNFKIPASLISCVGRFESNWSQTPKTGFLVMWLRSKLTYVCQVDSLFLPNGQFHLSLKVCLV